MSERSFCTFQRIHVRLTLASQVAYERFSFIFNFSFDFQLASCPRHVWYE